MLVGKGVRVHCGLFTLQKGRPRTGNAAAVVPEPRIGFTVTKKVGNAVERNRIRRRLREAVRLSAALPTEPETDYVVVARREALTVPFGQLIADLETTMRRSVGRSAARGSGKDRRGTVT